MTRKRLQLVAVSALTAFAHLLAPECLLPFQSPAAVIPASPSDAAKKEPAAYLASPLGFCEAGECRSRS
jgi:hypothetical protein